MDQVSYSEVVKRIINEYAAVKPSYGQVDVETVFDEERKHYELTWLGWDGYKRIHGPILHVDIRDGKVWIQHDGTERGIADELVEAGVPREHIVLGFHHPDARKHTPFAAS
ncbi:MAG: element excision factor XisI family protein [Candidatus Xenobia bacterium]